MGKVLGWGGSTAPALQREVRNCCGKTKTDNNPHQNPLAPLIVLSAISWGGCGGMEVVKLSWSLAMHRGHASEADAEGASPAQGLAVSPGTLRQRPPETRGMGTEKASLHKDI